VWYKAGQELENEASHVCKQKISAFVAYEAIDWPGKLQVFDSLSAKHSTCKCEKKLEASRDNDGIRLCSSLNTS